MRSRRETSAEAPHPPTGEKPGYYDGWADGAADKDPDPERLAYGADRLNDYERGYIDSGRKDG